MTNMSTIRAMRASVFVLLLAAAMLAFGASSALAGQSAPSASAIYFPGAEGWGITPGDVDAAGASGRFVVKDRTLSGVFLPGDISGPFSFTFGTNVPLQTQSGQFHGSLNVPATGVQAAARGSSKLAGEPALACLAACAVPGFPAGVPYAVAVSLDLTGSLTYTAGARGVAVIDGTITVAIDPDTGHILFLVPQGVPLLSLTDFTTVVGFLVTAIEITGL
jgi:hypothetical protein